MNLPINHFTSDGALLLSLTERDLDEMVQLSALQKRAFLLSVRTLQTEGVKAPSGLAEYKVTT